MAVRRSRTYRIRLSQEGTKLFLACHCRLAHLTGVFIPYGATLFVAVLLAEAGETSDIADELNARMLARLSGNQEHFVGASASLADIVTKVGDRVAQADAIAERPPVAHIHLASLAIMASCEDYALTKAYQRMTQLSESL
jgi:hypothetical protein